METVSYFGRIYKCLPIRYNRNKGNFRFPKGEVTMKNNRKPIFWRRGLALLLAVCLAAGYVPVPGYAEGCTHAHGEDCYEVTTQCVHSHDESCYTDPAIMEAGEEPDACAHVCAGETGCVTKALNCAHVHDSACGEAAEEEPKEEPQPEPQPEGKEEPKEEPKPQEEPKEEHKQEPQVKTVTAWTWLDEEEALDPETGKLCLVASEEAPIFLDQIVEVLPQAIEATVDGEGETLPVAAWTCGEYPEDGAYEGSFVLEAELPEGYALGDGVEALHVAVEFGGAVTLGENAVGVSLDGSWTSYATFDEAMRAVVTEGLSARSVEVKLYGNATSTGAYTIRNGMTLDLNGNRLEGLSVRADFSVGVGTLTLRDSSQSGGGSSNVKFQTAGGRIQVDSGEWEDITARNGSVTVDGGGVIKITAYDTVTLKGGKIDFLAVDKASVISLSYGTFEGIRGINQKVLAADLLAPGYAFRWDHDQKLQRYKDLPTLDDNTAIGNTTVVQCQSHVFETGNPNCIYCNTPCTHPTVNQTTGACVTCGKVLYDARLTIGESSRLFESMNDAFRALGERVGTVTLLRDVNTAYFYVYQNNVLDGNGHTIHGNLIIDVSAEEKSGGVIRNVTLKEGPDVIMGPQIIPVFGDNCVIYGFRTNGGELLALVQDGYAFYTDEGRTTFADPTVKKDWDVLYTGPHTHTKRQGYKTCACGYTFPYATVTKAPEPLKLTYTGQTQTLVTQGTAEGGEMLYSLEKDGYYGKTVPFGIVKTYTVYYMVRGDSGHLDTEPESVTVTIKPTKRLLDLTGLNLAGDITIDGVDYPIEASNDTLYVTIPETGDLFTYYGYKNIWASNEHSNYPTSMSVYAIERTPTGSTAREITELQDLLTYAGCSIRISGKQGIRMITALDEATKKALTGKGLAGYTLEEYGTVVSWTDALGNGSFLRLGESYARSNYAYRKGKADPVFARKNGIIQYTNVLVLENLTEADYDKDLTLRAYIQLRNTETGETVTLYGGTVTRSIYYVARQNADTYKPGTAGYKFVHKIIDAVD